MRTFLMICLVGAALLFASAPLSATPAPVDIKGGLGLHLDLSHYTGSTSTSSDFHPKGDLEDGKSTYFETTDTSGDDGDKADKEDCGDKGGEGESCEDDVEGGPKGVTPEPGSIMLLGTGLVVMGGALRRKLFP
jgi:hypothetical protein